MPIAVTHIIDSASLGGVATVVRTLALKQQEEGLKVDCIIITDRSGMGILEDFRALGLPVTVILRGKQLMPGQPLVKLSVLFQLLPLLKKRKQNILHLHLFMAAQMGRLGAAMASCPYVVETIHGATPFHNSFIWRRIIFPLMSLKTACFIAVSQATANHLKQVANIEAAVVYNGIYFKKGLSRKEAREILEISGNTFVAGFAGRLSEEKNLHTLLRAMQLLPKVILVIIGDGPLNKALKEKARQLGLENIRFVGAKPEAWRLFSAFNVICLPSYTEGHPITLLEAMYQKIPVIGSTAPAIVETLAEGRVGFLHAPEDFKALASQINDLQNNPQSCADMVERAYQRVTLNYSVNNMHNNLLEIYEQIVQQNN